MLADNRRRYAVWRAWKRRVAGTALADRFPPPPSITFFSLSNQFTVLRRETPWLQFLPFGIVRYTLKRQADAWQRTGKQGFTIPHDVKIKVGEVAGIRRLWIPKIGWVILSRSGGCPYDGAQPRQVVVKRVLGKWYATVFYAVPDVTVADNGVVVGIDRNVGQIALSTGEIIHLPDTSRLEARRKRYQRMMARRKKGSNRRALARHRAARISRKLAMIRSNWAHQTSRKIADAHGTVIVEDLNTQGMTASGKGKHGLNREILASAWSALRRNLEYKAANVVGVDPAYTSQTCSACGVTDKRSRKSQSEFECLHSGHEGNADINAALNILARGTGAAGRGGGGVARPEKRQEDMPRLASALAS